MQTKEVVPATWSELVSPEEWSVYERALNALCEMDIPFLFGGAFALSTYTGIWRDTKDLDLLILPEHRDRAVQAITAVGFDDYFDKVPYDQGWIFRSHRDGYIVDLIWRMANRRADVQQSWFDNAISAQIHGTVHGVVAPEELLWHKLYVLQRERCDWPDALNLLYTVGPHLDWKRVVALFGEDGALLNGLLNVFNWVCPGRVAEFPEWLRKQYHLKEPKKIAVTANEANVKFLDTRPWFAAFRSDFKPVTF
jgi:hypothetical protein